METPTRDDLLKLMRAKKKRTPGPRPEPQEYDSQDQWRAALFGHWLRTHGLTIDGFAAVSRRLAAPGVSRTAVISLSGAAGSAVTSRWSTLTRPTLLSLWRVMNLVEPLELPELRGMMRIPADHAPDVWREEAASAGAGEGRVEGLMVLRVTWDVTDPRPPHVYQDGDTYRIGDDVFAELLRLGRLREVKPLD